MYIYRVYIPAVADLLLSLSAVFLFLFSLCVCLLFLLVFVVINSYFIKRAHYAHTDYYKYI